MHALRPLPLLLLALLLGAPAGAEVLRCVDAAGKVSYTDGNCPAGARPERRVSTREPVQVLPGAAGTAPPAPPPELSTPKPVAPPKPVGPSQPPPAGGAVIIDGRGTSANERSDDSRWDTARGGDPLVVDESGAGYYDPYAGVQRPPLPRNNDRRARIRECDASGCRDGMGNTYNGNTGQLQRYKSIDGKTCYPTGSTTVCR